LTANVKRLMEEVFNKSKEALEIIENYAHITPLDKSYTFSRMTGSKIYLKYENLTKNGII